MRLNRILPTISALLLLGCNGQSDVDSAFGLNGTNTIEVPIGGTLSISITYPAADGNPIGWGTVLIGTCNQPGTVINITQDGGTAILGTAACGTSNTWRAWVTTSSLSLGSVTLKAIQSGQSDLTASATRSFTKTSTSCDLASARTGILGTGSGTALDPYIICTSTQLSEMRSQLTSHFKLGSDIDLYGGLFTPITSSYNATFDGDNFTIFNFRYMTSSEDDVGLFKLAQSSSELKNIKIYEAEVLGRDRVGVLAGRTMGAVSNVHIVGSATISGRSEVGGLVGRLQHTSGFSISSSTSSASVTGTSSYVGGLVGRMYTNTAQNGLVTNSSSTGSVTGNKNYVGGLVGAADYGAPATETNRGNITNSYATGAVSAIGDDTANYSYVGGLVGRAGVITTSYSTGNVIASNGNADDPTTWKYDYVGGLAGHSTGIVGTSGNRVYSTGNVTVTVNNSAQYIGGLAGYVLGSIDYAHATGNVSVETLATGNPSYIGGLAGVFTHTTTMQTVSNSYATGTVSSTVGDRIGGLIGASRGKVDTCYATGSVTGRDYAGGLIGEHQRTGAVAGAYDILSSYSSGSTISGRNYVGGITGFTSDANPGAVQTIALTSVSSSSNIVASGGHAGGIVGRLGSNDSSNVQITITNATWSGSSVTSSTNYAGGIVGGTGQNTTINTATASGSITSTGGGYTGGIVGYSNTGFSLTSGSSSGSISSGTSYAGGLVGRTGNTASITNSSCTASSVTTSTERAGGVLGHAGNSLTMSNCDSSASVSAGTQYAGGLIGRTGTSASITSNYASGTSVTAGTNYAGGLVGSASTSSTLTNNYSTVGTVTATGSYAGGLIATTGNGVTISGTTVADCYSTSFVRAATNYAGGLVGYLSSNTGGNVSSVDKCHATGNVYDTNTSSPTLNYAGGLVGRARTASSITNSYASGSVIANSNVGGLIGYQENSALTAQSFATGDATGSAATTYAGGLIGRTGNGTVRDSFAVGNAYGVRHVGGLVGSFGGGAGTLLRNLAFGNVYRTSGTQTNFGTLVGNGGASIDSNSFYLSTALIYDVPGSSSFAGVSRGTAYSDAQMKAAGSFPAFTFGGSPWIAPNATGITLPGSPSNFTPYYYPSLTY